MKGIILGTAGHIDHGKSSLVKALTGIDPDRLKEEKERGITIDLGFASLSYPDGLIVGIVDVPGHERLIKNMLAGAGGIDVVLMVIAADEGIMPQTREHLAICELLKIKKGIIALTKADLVDEEWLSLIRDDVRETVKGTFLEDAEIIPVSSKTGFNIDILKERIRELALNVEPRLINGLFRMPIDRVFTLKGFGTVVTGTAISGTISLDENVEILPSRIKSKVRGLQSHGKAVEKAFAGQRIGINLQGVEKDLLKRGDVVVKSERFIPTKVVDARLQMLKESPILKSRSLVHFYTYTSETVARIIIYDRDEISGGESCYCQFRLQDPVVVLSGDRYIIRRFSPLQTIGGGQILDPNPEKRRKTEGIEDLIKIEMGSLHDKIEMFIKKAGLKGKEFFNLEGLIKENIPDIREAVEDLVNKGILIRCRDTLYHRDIFNSFREELISILNKFHKDYPMKPGISKEDLKATLKIEPERSEGIFDLINLIGDIRVERNIVKLKDFKQSSVSEDIKEKLVAILEKNGFQPPFKEEFTKELSLNEREMGDILKVLTNEGLIVRINDSLYITKGLFDKMIGLLRNFYSKKSEMTVAEFRDILATTRKYALPFLEYLDSNRITHRVGDIRKFMLK